MRFIFRLFALVAFFAAWPGNLRADAPSFLPSYYSEGLIINGLAMIFRSQGQSDGLKHAFFTSIDQSVSLAIEHVACERAQCDALFEHNLQRQNDRLVANRGRFRTVTPTEFITSWTTDSKAYLSYFAKTPDALVVWILTSPSGRSLNDEAFTSTVRAVSNRHRYETAKAKGNVETGLWASNIFEHGRTLLNGGKKTQGLEVLRELTAWAPAHLEAHMAFAEATSDTAAARASAQNVWDNAEDPNLTGRAGRILGRADPDLVTLPLVETGLRGLQVVLLPLPPCDLRLVEEAGKLYSDSLNIPVRIARLPNQWTWQSPDRVFRERDVRMILQKGNSKPIDFSGWTSERYATALAAAGGSPFERYQIEDFLRSFPSKPGQYRVDGYIDRLVDILKPLRSGDPRTIFVGVTGADIFSGEANFLFSAAGPRPGGWGGILSYARMQADALGEPFQSRRRLAQRFAKELAPATLKQLEIPRPSDPTDPYSYSDGIQRLDQKTLAVSASTREALDRLRAP